MYAQMQANKERLRRDVEARLACFYERIMPADLDLAIDTARTIQQYTPRGTPRLIEE